MMNIRKSNERGHTKLDWLDSYHTFSFGYYQDPNNMGFRSLRVINDDIVKPAAGFSTHSHKDMEIITYVLDGALEHKDSLGNGSIIYPGELQRMSAGTGISHSEFNHSKTEAVHLLQIWILPSKHGIEPGYEQKKFPIKENPNQLHLIASPDGQTGSVTIHQNVKVYAASLKADGKFSHALGAGLNAWVHVAKGQIQLKGNTLEAGDGVSISQESEIKVEALSAAEVLLFELD
jgi:redox-sensitive bicupin YhaK (pirin superfamily)